MTAPPTLLFTANSPGEVAGWMAPLVREARRRRPGLRIVLLLLPCNFASGSEGRVALDLLGVDEVVPASGYPRLLLREGRRFRGAPLIHLGGDLMYAAFLSWRWGLSAWSYLWGRWWWDRAFQGYLVKDARGVEWLRRRRIPTRKAHVVGDLVADAAAAALEGGPRAPKGPGRLVGFLPGSRVHEVEGLAPFLLEVAERMAAGRPDVRFQMLLSPFLDRAAARAALEAPPHPKVGGVRGRIEGTALVSPRGVAVDLVWERPQAALARSDLAVSLPGTKTAEAASLGVPLLVFVPLNRPEKLPMGGLLGLLDWLPGGERLKGRLVLRLKETFGPVAQPNLLAGEAVVPEIVEVLTPEWLAREAGALLDRPEDLKRQSARLEALYAPSRGAAGRIFDVMEGRAWRTSP